MDYAGLNTAEGGTLIAALPDGPDDEQVWTLTYTRDGEVVFTDKSVRLMHEPIFGPDVEDFHAMENRVTELFTEYGVKE